MKELLVSLAERVLDFLSFLVRPTILGASLVYNNAMLESWTGVTNFTEGQNDIRVALLMTNTTADTEEEVTTVSGFTTLDEMDGVNYVRKTLASQAVAIDTANDRVEFDHEDLTWTALGNGTRAIQGMLYIRQVTNDTDSVPYTFTQFSSNQNPGGSDFTVTIDAEGALQLAQAL